MAKSEPTSAVPRVLWVEDDEVLRGVLAGELGRDGFFVVSVRSSAEAKEQLKLSAFDALLLDERLPGQRGTEFLKELRATGDETPVILLTGHGDIEFAVTALQAGAFHFLTKPCRLDVLAATLRRAVEHRALSLQARSVPRLTLSALPVNGIVGSSPAIQQLRSLIPRVAAASAPVLVTGESGVGKEVVARAVHETSPRRDAPFVAFNTAALPENLLESELFGHEKGAFTGADRASPGLLDAARGGTIFLDELAEMPILSQAKLLRFLQEGTFRRLGSTQERRADVRVLAATNVPLPPAIEAGRFRRDLYFRLAVVEIAVPPLRDRGNDVIELIDHWYARRSRTVPPELRTTEITRALQRYRWPGNVRELFNLLERLDILCGPGRAERELILQAVTSVALPVQSERLEDVELAHIRRVLEAVDGNRTEAARRLGISLKTLYNRLHAQDPPSGKSPE